MSQRTRAHTTGATHATTEQPAFTTAASAPSSETAPIADGAISELGATSEMAASSLAADATAATRTSATGATALVSTTGAGVEPLARALRAMATELERDPALARRVADAMQAPRQIARDGAPPLRGPLASPAPTSASDDAPSEQAPDTSSPTPTRVNRTFHPRIVTGTPPELGAGVPDPFALAERLGKVGLRAALADLRLGSLRAIVRERRLDPTGRLVGVNDAAKFRAVIIEAVEAVEAVEAAGAANVAAKPKRSTRNGRTADKSGQ